MIESPIIEKQKKFTYPLSFAFTFEKGEHKGESYQGHLDICSNPICPCRAVNFVITDIDKDKTGNPESKMQYHFNIDILEKKIYVDDQYCLNPKCSCKEMVLTIVPIIDGKSHAGRQAAAVRYVVAGR